MTQPATTAPSTTAATNGANIGLAEDGRIRGIDGMLDQVAGAAMRQARIELWPAWQADTAMQRTVGDAVGRGIGRGAADALAPWVAIGATSLAVGAAALVFRAWHARPARSTQNERSNPSRHSRRHRRRNGY